MNRHFLFAAGLLAIALASLCSAFLPIRPRVLSAAVLKSAGTRSYLYCAPPRGGALYRVTDSTRPAAPVLKGLGTYSLRISTKVLEAQAFFNQGLRLYYAFNHGEAYRSFVEAARRDSACAMCYWGQALALGPNINAPMDAADAGTVAAAVQQAQRLAPGATQEEQALINAVAARYVPNPPANRQPLDEAYAAAMRQAHARFPGHTDIATLYAEALMDLHPWEYWAKDGSPEAWTPEILALLEAVLGKDRHHPGANHFYIHAVEASPHPEKAMGSARLLPLLMPGAGHLVHMPSHIYIRTGLYHAGTLVNQASLWADQAYLNECNSQGLYAIAYYPHNIHFLWACATMEGRGRLAMEAARMLQQQHNKALMLSPFGFILQHMHATPIFTMVRFGQWDSLMAMPPPDTALRFVSAMWHYGRGVAFARKGMYNNASAARDSLLALEGDSSLAAISAGARNKPSQLLALAIKMLNAEIALAQEQKDYPGAIGELRAAVQLEDALSYNEPADWPLPVRIVLGAVLMESGDYKEAEAQYRQDLQQHPANGWALMGLYQSLKAQGRTQEAMAAKRWFDRAFINADVQLSASRI